MHGGSSPPGPGGSSLSQGGPPGLPVTEEASPKPSAVLGHTGQELDCTQAWSSVHVVVVARLPSPVRLCDPVACSTPGSSVLHYFQELAQIHVR